MQGPRISWWLLKALKRAGRTCSLDEQGSEKKFKEIKIKTSILTLPPFAKMFNIYSSVFDGHIISDLLLPPYPIVGRRSIVT
jgi:hypothetical protein